MKIIPPRKAGTANHLCFICAYLWLKKIGIVLARLSLKSVDHKMNHSERLVPDAENLEKLIPFTYLQLFTSDSYDSPTAFLEHPVPEKFAAPAESKFYLLSNRALMQLALARKPFLFLSAKELARGFRLNAFLAFIEVAGVPVILLFYTRATKAPTVDPSQIAKMIKVLKN